MKKKCIKCDNEYPFTAEYFTQDKSKKFGIRSICKECGNKQRNIEKYKKKYGIILEFNKYFNTYSIINWWEFLYYKTPNGKNIYQIPTEILNNENLLILMKYIYDNIISSDEYENTCFNIETTKKLKINWVLDFYKLGLIDFIIMINEKCGINLSNSKIKIYPKYEPKQKIIKESSGSWSKEEIDLLKNSEGMNIEDIVPLLNNKTYVSTYSKCKTFNYNLNNKAKYWTNDELDIIKSFDHSNKSMQDLLLMLPNRTVYGVNKKLAQLKIKLKNPSTICISDTKDWMNKEGKKLYYKNFGIELDNESSTGKYDIIQWWKWIYYGTPNGKLLYAIPLNVKTNDSIIKLCRFVIINIIGLDNKQKLVDNIYYKMFVEYKILYSLFDGMTLCDILNYIFPEYNVKVYELNNVSLKFWQDKDNLNEYVEYVLYDIINVNALSNIRNELPIIFKDRHNHKINNILTYIYKYNHYDSIFDCISTLYPEFKLEEKDFRIYTGVDGFSKFYSYEEEMVFDYIYQYLEIDSIMAIGSGKKKKYRFYPDNTDNYYCPDFYLETIGSYVLDKPLIIEYYGLFDIKAKNNLYVEYRNKTYRKENYYNNNKEIYYIGIYPNDLKNNCKGVMDKLNDFIMLYLEKVGELSA